MWFIRQVASTPIHTCRCRSWEQLRWMTFIMGHWQHWLEEQRWSVGYFILSHPALNFQFCHQIVIIALSSIDKPYQRRSNQTCVLLMSVMYIVIVIILSIYIYQYLILSKIPDSPVCTLPLFKSGNPQNNEISTSVLRGAIALKDG